VELVEEATLQLHQAVQIFLAMLMPVVMAGLLPLQYTQGMVSLAAALQSLVLTLVAMALLEAEELDQFPPQPVDLVVMGFTHRVLLLARQELVEVVT
jgi:hypothetical protein